MTDLDKSVLNNEPGVPAAPSVARKMTGAAMETYPSRNERAALRCALGDAAAMCDALAREIAAENRGRNGKGAVTKLGMQLEQMALRCGDAIWRMRDSVTAPQPERVSDRRASNTDAAQATPSGTTPIAGGGR